MTRRLPDIDFSTFRSRVMAVFVKRHQKVFPLPIVRALSVSNSPSSLSAQAPKKTHFLLLTMFRPRKKLFKGKSTIFKEKSTPFQNNYQALKKFRVFFWD